MLDSPGPIANELCESHSPTARFQQARCDSLTLSSPLSEEDCQLQSMPDASPAKWHLAHTTWFFETFLLAPLRDNYQPYDPDFALLFNSYYNVIGAQFSRPQRGLLSRPSLDQVLRYRDHVDRHMLTLLQQDNVPSELIELGIQHEKQHQELLLMDIKHAFYQNPSYPAYHRPTTARQALGSQPAVSWSHFDEGLVEIGAGRGGFSFDNERPVHKVWLNAYELANRPVSNGDFIAFIEDRGYQRPEFWLSDGWALIQSEQRRAPQYWQRHEGKWWEFSLMGLRPLHRAQSLCHINFYEAAAYANWAGARLPTEAEWEHASHSVALQGHFADRGYYHPEAAGPEPLAQLFGDIWEWTNSSYQPYPGFTPFAGNAGEYSGKFMAGQYVLRGGACISPADHLRHSYRNFFYPHQYWQCAGLRLARDAA